MINILNVDGTLNEEGGPFAGLDRFDARTAVKERLAELGLDRGSKEHVMALPRSQRSGVPVEPMLSTQWFVRMEELAAPAIEAIETGRTRFVPKRGRIHITPGCETFKTGVFLDNCGGDIGYPHGMTLKTMCTLDVMRRRSDASSPDCDVALTQDEDVLDTWFSSALVGFSTFGWPEDTESLKKYYPTSVLITGFDIIFFWVARMMFSGLYFQDEVPFKDIYIHALVRDEHGQKMSKQKATWSIH